METESTTLKTVERSLWATIVYLRTVERTVTLTGLYTMLWCPPAPLLSFEDFCDMVCRSGGEIFMGYVAWNDQDRANAEKMRRAATPTELMMRRACRAVRLVSWVPYLKGVLVCNSVGAQYARCDSDIDWLVITAPGKEWVVRAVLNGILKLFGLRTGAHHEAGRICLSFFIDNDHLDLGPYRAVEEDIHGAYWLHDMFPIYGMEQSNRFLKANTWVRRYLPGTPTVYTSQYCVHVPVVLRTVQRVLEWVLDRGGVRIVRWCRWLQFHYLNTSLKTKALLEDNGVVIAPGVLKFHEHDTRREIYTRWKSLIDNEQTASGGGFKC